MPQAEGCIEGAIFALVNEPGAIRVRDSPTGRDTICDVGEMVSTLELDEVSEDCSLQKLTVQFGYTVDLTISESSGWIVKGVP